MGLRGGLGPKKRNKNKKGPFGCLVCDRVGPRPNVAYRPNWLVSKIVSELAVVTVRSWKFL